MTLTITGNRESFQFSQKIAYVNWSLDSIFQPFHDFSATISVDNQHYAVLNNQDLFRLSNELKGIHFSQVIHVLGKIPVMADIINRISTATTQEINLFKSLFLIYQWLEYYLSINASTEIFQCTSDQFIIDYSGKPESQNDIYFIKRQYIYRENIPLIEKLIDLNLLAQCKLSNFQPEVNSYFIPLSIPGVSLNHFASDYDETGHLTYSLWRKILDDRDSKIKTWFLNRS